MPIEKQPLLTGKPVPTQYQLAAGTPPAYGDIDAGNAAAKTLDPLAIQKLHKTARFGLVQGNKLAETVAPCCQNMYAVTDRSSQIPVAGRPQDMVDVPLFIVQEESECCLRVCCGGKHPMLAKFHHALPPTAGQTCCGCYMGHNYNPDPTKPVVMTVERDGCCNKWIGCFACGSCCLSEAWLHAGDVSGKPGTLAAMPNANVIGRSVMPPDGGCFTPTLNIFTQAATSKNEEHYGDLTGPCFFGGCLDLCTDTIFQLTSANSQMKGDLGSIVKEKPDGFCDMCMQCSGDVDNYHIDLFEQQAKPITPAQKANMLGTAVHLDYWFFQHDPRPIENHGNGKSGVIIITLCNMYCRGCIWPVQICIPYGSK